MKNHSITKQGKTTALTATASDWPLSIWKDQGFYRKTIFPSLQNSVEHNEKLSFLIIVLEKSGKERGSMAGLRMKKICDLGNLEYQDPSLASGTVLWVLLST